MLSKLEEAETKNQIQILRYKTFIYLEDKVEKNLGYKYVFFIYICQGSRQKKKSETQNKQK